MQFGVLISRTTAAPVDTISKSKTYRKYLWCIYNCVIIKFVLKIMKISIYKKVEAIDYQILIL